MTVKQLEQRFPAILWREPVLIRVADGSGAFGCRVCIANFGLRGFEVAGLPQTREEFAEHWEKLHKDEVNPGGDL